MNQLSLTTRSFNDFTQPQASSTNDSSATVWDDQHGHAGTPSCFSAASGLGGATRQLRAYGARSRHPVHSSRVEKRTLACGIQETGRPLRDDDAVVFRLKRARPLSLYIYMRLTYSFGCASDEAAESGCQHAISTRGTSSTTFTKRLAVGCALEQIPSPPGRCAALMARTTAAGMLAHTAENPFYLSPAEFGKQLTARHLGLATAPRLRCDSKGLPGVLGALHGENVGHASNALMNVV